MPFRRQWPPHGDRSVSGTDAQRLSAGAEAAAHVVPVELAADVGEPDILKVDPTVAGTRVELAAKRVGQIDGDRAVAGIDVPVRVGRTAVSTEFAAIGSSGGFAGRSTGTSGVVCRPIVSAQPPLS